MFLLIEVSTRVHYMRHDTFTCEHYCSMCLYTRVPLMCGKYLDVHSATHAFLVYPIRYHEIPSRFLKTLEIVNWNMSCTIYTYLSQTAGMMAITYLLIK